MTRQNLLISFSSSTDEFVQFLSSLISLFTPANFFLALKNPESVATIDPIFPYHRPPLSKTYLTGVDYNEVVCADGTSFPGDLIIIGVGIRVNSELTEAAGLEIENGRIAF